MVLSSANATSFACRRIQSPQSSRNRMNRYPFSVLTLVAALVVPQWAAAEGPQWSALIEFDDGGLAPTMFRVVGDSETACLAEVSSYRGAVAIEPCLPALTPSAITDPNDANRTAKTPKPVQPSGGGGTGSGSGASGGTGSSGGGAGGGGAGGW